MNQRLGNGGGEVGVLSPSAPGALANLWRTWIREETQLRHGVCLTVTVMSVVRLRQTGPRAGELREKEEGQAGWSPSQVCAQSYMHMDTCGNHVHSHGHSHTGSLRALSMSPVTKLCCLCTPVHLKSLTIVTVAAWLCWHDPGFLRPIPSEHLIAT